jgi:SAM-dependent methyltransferase
MNREQYVRMRAVEDRHWWYRGTRAIFWDVLSGLDLGEGARILDAGCGTGGNLGMLGRLGPVVGLDFSELALELAAERGGARFARGSVAAVPFEDSSFDLVTSFDVLCHRSIGDDVDARRELARVLRRGGWVLLQLPGLDWLRGAHDVEVHTVRRYTTAGLREKLVAAGLQPVRLTYVNGLLLPFAAAKRVSDRLRGAHGDDLGEIPPLLDAFFRSAMAAERQILRRRDLPAGVSVLGLARREAR